MRDALKTCLERK